jgi:predicted  nucleic acid-binding Zn-ribbon protein
VTDELRVHWKLHGLDEQTVAREQLLARHPEQRRAQEKRVATARQALAALDARVDALQRRRRVLEGEIAEIESRQRVGQEKAQRVTTQQQFEAHQHEAAALRDQRDVLETEVLEGLEAEERDAAHRPELALALARAETEAATVFARLEAEQGTLMGELAVLDAERRAATAQLPDASRTRYERLRAGRSGIAVASCEGGACGACGQALSPAAVQETRRRESLRSCEGCGRLLLLPPEAGAGT